MTHLQKCLNDYLALRRTLGFKLIREGMWLPDFVRSIKANKSSYVTVEASLRWAKGKKSPPPPSWVKRLGMAKKFSLYLHALDPRHEVIPKELVAYESRKKFCPFIYSNEDVLRLMRESKKLRTRFKRDTYSTLIGLLASTGMRVGEAIRLDKTDFNSSLGLIQIRHSKFGKSRQIPLHPTTTKALCRYAKKRDHNITKNPNPAFFLSTSGTRVRHVNFHHAFHKMVLSIGIGTSHPQGPRIHDLRHSFAVKTLTTWYRSDLDTGSRLPALSTYLGHVSPSSTYVYLHATTELLQQAKKKLERSQRGVRS